MKEKVIIVGGGISGLTAGIYAQRSGFDVLILEKCATPGGVSTCWKRKGYMFEGGVHWLNGSGEDLDLHKVWKEVGALQDNNPVYFKDPVYVLKGGKGEISIHRDAARTLEELSAYSPGDKRVLRSIFRDLRMFRYFQSPVEGVTGIWDYIRMFPAICITPRLWMQSITHYLSRIKDPDVRTLLEAVVAPVNNALTFAYTLSSFFNGDSGYPSGGSLRMALNMADTFVKAGGEIRYNTAVEKVVDGGVIVGGDLLKADAVIVTVDARTAIDKLFEKPLEDGWARRMRKLLVTSQTVFVGIGVEADLNNYPKSMVLKVPFKDGGVDLPFFIVSNYARDHYSPEGCTTLSALFPGYTYGWWKAAKEDGSYEAKKEAVAQKVIGILEEQIPEIKGKVAVWDVATPLTYQRYCDTFDGSYMSDWLPRTFTTNAPNRYRKGLYFAGQRTAYSGGLPPAVISGRIAARLLCKDFGLKFKNQ
ncbi:MAG: NAD(P)/FAD-dependent oxidoreductase [Bacteroidales bacterium]|nr:NAD(P)/FAD-dependent oxidoreductase [Bacteroidales bacterium]